MTNNSSPGSDCGNPQEKTILIASDDEMRRELLYYIVQKAGFRIEKVDSARETIEKARTILPDLILLGLNPHASYEALRELQTDEAVNIPIILLSNHKIDPSTAELLRQEPNVKGLLQLLPDATNLAALLHRLLMTKPPVESKKE